MDILVAAYWGTSADVDAAIVVIILLFIEEPGNRAFSAQARRNGPRGDPGVVEGPNKQTSECSLVHESRTRN